MTNINLLPWREKRREELKKQFVSLLAVAGVACLLLMIGVHLIYSARIGNQMSRNDFLKAEIKKIDSEIVEIRDLKKQRAALTGRMQVIQSLQTNRTQVVHIFEEFVRVLPNGINLVEVSTNGDVITILGRSESNSNISQMMRNVASSKWVTNPTLSTIKTEKMSEKEVSEFRLQFVQGNRHFIKDGSENGNKL